VAHTSSRARIPWLAWLVPALIVAFAFAQEVVTITDAQIARLAQTFGPVAKERLTSWRALMNNPKNRALSDRQKAVLVNDFMNITPFKSDREHWGKEDYWATPIEFLSTNGGDCEDYSIAKYFTLRALGMSDEKLQITYVKEIRVYNEAHMVLAFFQNLDAEPEILDNINKTLQPASSRTDLVPVYSFNGSGLWLAKEQTGRGQSVGSADRIGHWKDLQGRMKSAI
jgi:predicted transglutaminase-like cysteine proteinase